MLAGDLTAHANWMSARDIKLIRKLEAEGFTLLAAAVAECLQGAADRAAEPRAPQKLLYFVLPDGGWQQDETVATGRGDRGHRTGRARWLRRQRAS
jgi:hypothetical protein